MCESNCCVDFQQISLKSSVAAGCLCMWCRCCVYFVVAAILLLFVFAGVSVFVLTSLFKYLVKAHTNSILKMHNIFVLLLIFVHVFCCFFVLAVFCTIRSSTTLDQNCTIIDPFASRWQICRKKCLHYAFTLVQSSSTFPIDWLHLHRCCLQLHRGFSESFTKRQLILVTFGFNRSV